MNRASPIFTALTSVALAAAQLICLCGPVGAADLVNSVAEVSSQAHSVAHEGHNMAAHHNGPEPSNTSSQAPCHDDPDCLHCGDTVSALGSHSVTVTSAIEQHELMVAWPTATHQALTASSTQYFWPPPDTTQRVPQTPVSLKTLLLM